MSALETESEQTSTLNYGPHMWIKQL